VTAPPDREIPTDDPPRMSGAEGSLLRLAAIRATKVLPPGLAELVSRELRFFAEMGLALPVPAVTRRAADELMRMPPRETST
jgi:hypothetical protein